MKDFHGILVEESFEKEILNKFHIIGKQKDNNFNLLKISVSQSELSSTINFIQQNLNSKYYAHLYKDDKLIVIFSNKIFEITPEKSTWDVAINYGKVIGIPESQLDFKPCRIEDETY